MQAFSQAILAKKAALAEGVSAPLAALAERCAPAWADADHLDRILVEAIAGLPNCAALYAWNIHGVAVSSVVQPERVDCEWRGRDLSERPYLKNNLPFKGIMLSSVYDSMLNGRQCVTALHAVRTNDQLLGFLAADFPLGELLLDAQLAPSETCWRQFKGDPAVRGTLFLQTRVQGKMDDRIDESLANVLRLMTDHGVFHCKIHFSSGRCSFWLLDDPYSYRIHTVDEIIDPDICLAYPLHPYPEEAKVTLDQIAAVFDELKELRFADDTVYLRSASLNVMNGMLGLTFSCDGSHYMPWEEFLDKNVGFWLGSGAQQA